MMGYHPSPLTPHLHQASPQMFRGIKKKGPETKTDSLEHFLGINLRREGPKTKSGSLEHFLRIDLRGGGGGFIPLTPNCWPEAPWGGGVAS